MKLTGIDVPFGSLFEKCIQDEKFVIRGSGLQLLDLISCSLELLLQKGFPVSKVRSRRYSVVLTASEDMMAIEWRRSK
jgi:hypothetical protein